jgi:hypothetical protein
MEGAEQEPTSALRPSASDYGYLDRREFACNHEGFFRLCMLGMKLRDDDILTHRWFAGRTLTETGMLYDISRERVRSIEAKAFWIIFRAIKTLWQGL